MCAEHRADRRVFPRAAAMGSAIVLTSGRYVGTYVLDNVSASGALLVGDSSLSVGDDVRLLLQLNHRARRFALEGSVVRRSTRDGRGLFAVAFANVAAAIEDALLAEVVRHLEARRSEVVLIVNLSVDDAPWLERDLHAAGHEAVVAYSPLDAIVWLEAPETSVRAVIANGGADSVDGLSLLEFIAHDYPGVRRILGCSSPLGGAHEAALASELVHALLEKPWTRDSLLLALTESRQPAKYTMP